MKLSARGGHSWWNESILSVAAAGCSLCAIRYTAAATMTEALWFFGARAMSSKPTKGARSGRTTVVQLVTVG